MKTFLATLGATFVVTAGLVATPVNITVFDGQSGNGATSPWKGTPGLGAGFEDNETEPRTITGDQWDVEAFVYNPSSKNLSLVGTYDFLNGATANGVTHTSGAIFVRDAGSGSWTYAYMLDLANGTYTVYDSFATLMPGDIPASGPWTVDVSAPNNVLGTGTLTYNTGILDPFGLGLQRQSGTGHNQIDLSLGLLPGGVLDSFDVHFTMSCGNDLIEGRYSSVPDGGTTALLLGLTTMLLMLVRRPVLAIRRV